MVGLNAYAVLDFLDTGIVGSARQKRGQQARVIGVQMLDENKRHAGVRRQGGQKFGKCL